MIDQKTHISSLQELRNLAFLAGAVFATDMVKAAQEKYLIRPKTMADTLSEVIYDIHHNKNTIPHPNLRGLRDEIILTVTRELLKSPLQ